MSTLMSYLERREQLHARLADQAPAALLDGFAAAAQRLDAVDFATRAPRVGDEAPDFALPDQHGDEVWLSALLRGGPALLRGGPVVLIFYRGEWCPYCNLQLRAFQANLAQLAEHRAQLVAISPQTPDHSLSMAEKNDLEFVVLSDVGAQVIDRYGLRYEVDDETRVLFESVGNDLDKHNGAGHWVLPAAAAFVIDRRGIVRYVNVRGDWRERAEPADVLTVLTQLP
jgi:peroxiredoxin